jgi:hypothetical protein
MSLPANFIREAFVFRATAITWPIGVRAWYVLRRSASVGIIANCRDCWKESKEEYKNNRVDVATGFAMATVHEERADFVL